MDQINPVGLILLLKIMKILQEKIHIQRMGKKTGIGNTKKIWRLNIDISIYRDSIR
jgi:hypothetical protein